MINPNDGVSAVQEMGFTPAVQQGIFFLVVLLVLVFAIGYIINQFKKPPVEVTALAKAQAEMMQQMADQNEDNIARAAVATRNYELIFVEMSELKTKFTLAMHEVESCRVVEQRLHSKLDEKDARLDALFASSEKDRQAFADERLEYLQVIRLQESKLVKMSKDIDELQARLAEDERNAFVCPFDPQANTAIDNNGAHAHAVV